MAKTEVTRVVPNLPAVPDYLKEQPIEGVEELSQHIRPPFLKIVQKQADDALIEQFGVGSAVLVPVRALVAENDAPFKFVPLFHYTEYCIWPAIEHRGEAPMIVERSTDRRSTIAQRALNPNLRIDEKYVWDGKRLKVRFVQHINFIVTLYGHPLAGEPILLGFSRAESNVGSSLAAMIKMRKASLYDCVFEARVCKEPRKNQKGSWYGFNLENPRQGSPWVTAEEHEQFKAVFHDLHSHFEAGRIKAEYDTEAPEEDAAETDAVPM